jgi:hypothetical protein
MAGMSPPPVSIVTVTRDGLFFTRLLVEKVREFTRGRDYEILAVDRGSRDGSRDWLRAQPDVRLFRYGQWRSRDHGHAEAARKAIRAARHARIVLLDSDAHPVAADWLETSADRLDEQHRLAGAVFVDKHAGNPHGWYIHPHFMCFFRADFGGLVELRKLRGDATDTGEEATIRVLAAGLQVVGLPIRFADALAVGHPRVPTLAGGVFHAWYVTRLAHTEAEVDRESGGEVTRAGYMLPLMARLREAYGLGW